MKDPLLLLPLYRLPLLNWNVVFNDTSYKPSNSPMTQAFLKAMTPEAIEHGVVVCLDDFADADQAKSFLVAVVEGCAELKLKVASVDAGDVIEHRGFMLENPRHNKVVLKFEANQPQAA